MNLGKPGNDTTRWRVREYRRDRSKNYRRCDLSTSRGLWFVAVALREFCFATVPKTLALMGAQFRRHGHRRVPYRRGSTGPTELTNGTPDLEVWTKPTCIIWQTTIRSTGVGVTGPHAEGPRRWDVGSDPRRGDRVFLTAAWDIDSRTDASRFPKSRTSGASSGSRTAIPPRPLITSRSPL